MREENDWPDRDTDLVEETEAIPPVRPAEDTQVISDDPLREREPEYAENDEELLGELLEGNRVLEPETPARRFRKGVGKVFMITGGVIALLVLLYTADLMLSAGDVPRGVTVLGVDVGGMSRTDAEAKLRKELEPKLVQPVAIRAGDVETKLDPVSAGLALDWPSTLDHAGHQPLNPITRVLSFFTTREVGVDTKAQSKTLNQGITELAEKQLNHPSVEGSIGFMPIPGSDGGVVPFAVEPRQAQTISDPARAADIVEKDWLRKPGAIELPMNVTPVKASSAGVHRAMDTLVSPAVAKPITVHGDGKDVQLKPDAIANAFRFKAVDGGALEVRIDQFGLQRGLEPQLADTEKPGKDAQIVFAGGVPTVQPSEDAKKISWVSTFKPFNEIMTRPDGRDLKVAYEVKPPALTTDGANALGIKEVVGEFSTSGLSGGAATNVQAIAAKVNGAVLKPGETFSLDGQTGPRSESGGFVSAPVNEDGSGPEVIGGGVSQFTSTLYNAAYLAGMKDAGHTEHPYYLDRYPAGRDAKSLEDNGSTVDMKFTNDGPTGIAIQATASGDSVDVKLWGTKHYRVESSGGDRSDVTVPPFEPGQPGCQPSSGQPGFTTTDTRTLYDIASGAEVRSETRTVRYNPKPFVFC